MIRVMLYELAHRKKKRMIEISNETGISRNTLSQINLENVKMIQLNTIEKLCKYFDCQPGDLLKYEKDND